MTHRLETCWCNIVHCSVNLFSIHFLHFQQRSVASQSHSRRYFLYRCKFLFWISSVWDSTSASLSVLFVLLSSVALVVFPPISCFSREKVHCSVSNSPAERRGRTALMTGDKGRSSTTCAELPVSATLDSAPVALPRLTLPPSFCPSLPSLPPFHLDWSWKQRQRQHGSQRDQRGWQGKGEGESDKKEEPACVPAVSGEKEDRHHRGWRHGERWHQPGDAD